MESIKHGQELFQKLECWKCHGQEGRVMVPSASTLTDSNDQLIHLQGAQKVDQSHASSGLTTSPNDGIGVHRLGQKDLVKIFGRRPALVPRSRGKIVGRIGWSLLSVSVDADGPSPRPSCP